MYALRGIAVSLSTFAAVYCLSSVIVHFGWKGFRQRVQSHPARRIADLLFALSMFPFVSAALITVALTVPSFILLEPRAIEEALGTGPLVLGLCGAAILVAGLGNAAGSIFRASRTISTWERKSQLIPSDMSVPLFRIAPPIPAMTAAGILHPRILVSGATESLLTTCELRCALNHELAHVRRCDNLKKLLLRFAVFPGMSRLEVNWHEATEMAADDDAASSAEEALDLAAALIKLSRLGPTGPSVELATALLHDAGAVMNARVERLIAWSEVRRVQPRAFPAWYSLGAAMTVIAIFIATYNQLLLHVHSATEWLVH